MTRAPTDLSAVSAEVDLTRTPEAASGFVDLTGQLLSMRYELLEIVGGGGMGTVYRAIDRQTQHELAVKVLDPRFDPSKDPIYRERFLREARLSTRLSHGNIVEVLDTGESDGVHFIAMELLRGRTLAELLEIERVIGWERAIKLLRQIGAGLAFAHELGLVHRDLKPANCFVLGSKENEWLKLLDFGLAKPVTNTAGDNEVTRTTTVMGSPAYMAPEQARGEAAVQADIYALGVLLFRMLAGQVPFSGRTAIDVIVQHIQSPLPWLREVTLAANVPIELELVMRRCLEKDPRARYPSVQALLFAIDEAEAQANGHPTQRLATQVIAQARIATLPPPPPPSIAPVLPPPPPSAALDFVSLAPPAPRTPTAIFTAVREHRRGRGLLWSGAFLGLSLGGILVWRSSQPVEPVAEEPHLTPPPAVASPAATAVTAEPAVRPSAVTFRINSIPTGATVKIGSKVMGITPTTLEMPADETGEATVELTLEAKGYQSITFIATSPGPRFDLVQRLQKGSGRVQLAKQAGSTPPDQTDEDPSVVIPLPIPLEPAVVAKEPATAPAVEIAPPPPPSTSATLSAIVPMPAPPVAEPPKPLVPVAGRIYSQEELTSRPRLLAVGQLPRYSEAARIVKSEGTAVARCVVSALGRLGDCRMLKSVPLMDEEILESLKTRLYEPGRLGSEAVPSEIKIVLRVEAR